MSIRNTSEPASAILHPTDFSEASENAFAHALAIALNNKANLTILHVIPDREDVVEWHEFPSVRQTLERWGLLKEDSHRSEVASKLGVSVRKEISADRDIAHAIAEYTKLNSCDLLVMSTETDRRLPRWLNPGTAMTASKATDVPTLFVPNDVEGCVSKIDGSVSLAKVLLAIDNSPLAQNAVNRIANALRSAGSQGASVSLLYVGEEQNAPEISIPTDESLEWRQICRQGNVASEVIAAINDEQADLVALATNEKKTVWQALTGDSVERVVRGAHRPVFVIPS